MHHLPFLKYGIFKHMFLFKGGGGGGGGLTASSSAPPPTTQSVEIQQAQRDVRKQAGKRMGMSNTVLAGETGGYNGTETATLGSTGATAPATQTNAARSTTTVLGGSAPVSTAPIVTRRGGITPAMTNNNFTQPDITKLTRKPRGGYMQ
jgi:hypothetical protein